MFIGMLVVISPFTFLLFFQIKFANLRVCVQSLFMLLASLKFFLVTLYDCFHISVITSVD